LVQAHSGDTSAATEALRDNLRELMKAVRLLKQQPEASSVPAGLMGVLSTISTTDGSCCHVKDLAARTALDPSTVSRAVAALVRSGLVRRDADPSDGRASMLELTEQGQAALDDAYRRYDTLITEALAGWSPAEIAAFSTMLRRFAGDVLTRLGRGTRPLAETDPPNIILEAAR